MWGQAVSKRAMLRWANGADGWARSVIRTVRAWAEGERGAGLADARGRWAALEFGVRVWAAAGPRKGKRPDWVGLVGLGCWTTCWAEDLAAAAG